ncbi:MAG: hypothetical protein M3Q08_04365 [Pseudomonadota bacterium]|nr:hypothetical protein [Pseudomonadota bacterium]
MAFGAGYWIGAIFGGFVWGYLVSLGLDRWLIRRFVTERATAIAASCVAAYALLMTLAALGSADGGPVTLDTVPMIPYAVGVLLAWAGRLKRDKNSATSTN